MIPKTNNGIARGWFLLAAGAAIIALLAIVLIGAEPLRDVVSSEMVSTSTEEIAQVEETIQAEPEPWITYENEAFGFAIDHPPGWEVVSGDHLADPMITIYRPPLPDGLTAPLTHQDDATHVSVYPNGIATEGMYGRTTATEVEMQPQLSGGYDYVLKDGQPWATYLAFSNMPSSWGPSGFVWGRVRISDLAMACDRDGKTIDMRECDPLIMQDTIERIGTVEASEREAVVRMLESFRFINE